MKLSEMLTQDKWLKGNTFIGEKMCLGFALSKAELYNPMWWNHPTYDLLGTVVQELFPERVPKEVKAIVRVPVFNDHPDTTWEDVEKVIREYEYRRELLNL